MFYICDHDEVWAVAIEATPRVELIDNAPYKFVENRTDFLGLAFDGLATNDPVMRVGQNEISYDFDPKEDFVTIKYKTVSQHGQIEFRTPSGDWFAASLSDDGRHLVLAEPYDIALYESD